jgi:hypothetical protein
VTVLSERGVKTRVVTVGPAWSQVLGHAVRKRFLRALKACPGTFAPLTGASDEQLLGLFTGGHSDTLVSTDLTRATDLLPHDLVAAIVDGLAESGKLSDLEVEVLRALTGPQILAYGDKTITSSRGILMGLPTSWVLLSIIHLWWMDEVRRTSPPGKERSAHKHAICGDDALLSTTRVGAARYREIVSASGGSPSEGKHYECLGKKGNLRGVFLEKLLEFDHKAGRITGGVINGAIPVKGLTSRSLPRDFFGTTPVRCDSFALVQLMVLDTLGARPSAMPACRDYIRTRVPWLWKYGRVVLGLAPGHPLSLGGWRFADRTPEGDLLAKQVRDSGKSFTVCVRREADPEWRRASKFVSENMSTAEFEWAFLPLGPLPPAASDFVGPLELGAVRLPEDPAGFDVFVRDDRVVVEVMGAYMQYKAFSFRKSEVFHVRAKDLSRKLRRLRQEGTRAPCPLPFPEVQKLQMLYARRNSKSELIGRWDSWFTASLLPRSVAVATVSHRARLLPLQAMD